MMSLQLSPWLSLPADEEAFERTQQGRRTKLPDFLLLTMSETVQLVNRAIYHPPRQSTEILFEAELILVSDTNRVRNRAR
ncbi:hypothetical protein CEXT_552571 [Caerostris extrusa]|uniref:Uncharacterized protein n=1 Tax=Caerostris extrusa TaxID=172846 RepID=A0AAV4VSS8_CAEEX|nr:hypothetical protein CEXT_552571 [Caerostris extrusa]